MTVQNPPLKLSAVVLGLALSACANPPPRLAEKDGSYCYRVGHGSVARRTCTTTAVPEEAVQAEARRFETRADVATLYVVRRRWADTINRVAVHIDGRRSVDTIPESVVRIRLRPGSHQLSLDWQGHIDTRTLALRAGELRFLEIDGSALIGATGYRWFSGDSEADIVDARGRATRSELIADIDLSAP